MSSDSESDLTKRETVPHLLYSCNKAWASALVHNPYTRDIFIRSAEGQKPKLLWIGCADSRAPETAVTNLAPGDLFVHRNIANQFLPLKLDVSAHAVLDYAVLHLNVHHVAIVGHSHCGGVEAAYDAIRNTGGRSIFDTEEGKEGFAFQEDARHLLAPGSESTRDASKPINTWLASLIELARELDEDHQFDPSDHAKSIKILTEASVKRQVSNVVKTFPKGDRGDHKLNVWVHGWVYEVETGRLRDLEVTEKVTAYVTPKALKD